MSALQNSTLSANCSSNIGMFFISPAAVQQSLISGYLRRNIPQIIPSCISDLCFMFYYLKFKDYRPEHIAQVITFITEQEFKEDGQTCDLYKIVFDSNINGAKFIEILSPFGMKFEINKKIKDGKHKITGSTINYIMNQQKNGYMIKPEWTCNDVLQFLYFAESKMITEAIMSLQINGQLFLQMKKDYFVLQFTRENICNICITYFHKIVE